MTRPPLPKGVIVHMPPDGPEPDPPALWLACSEGDAPRVIAVSGYDAADAGRVAADELGTDAVVVRPIRPEELLFLIGRPLQLSDFDPSLGAPAHNTRPFIYGTMATLLDPQSTATDDGRDFFGRRVVVLDRVHRYAIGNSVEIRRSEVAVVQTVSIEHGLFRLLVQGEWILIQASPIGDGAFEDLWLDEREGP